MVVFALELITALMFGCLVVMFTLVQRTHRLRAEMCRTASLIGAYGIAAVVFEDQDGVLRARGAMRREDVFTLARWLSDCPRDDNAIAAAIESFPFIHDEP